MIIRDNPTGKVLLTALTRAFAELERLAAPQQAIIFTESELTQNYLLSQLADRHYGEASSAATAQTVMLEIRRSTLSGLIYLPHIREGKALGYRISLFF